jgi:hypothetical protein
MPKPSHSRPTALTALCLAVPLALGACQTTAQRDAFRYTNLETTNLSVTSGRHFGSRFIVVKKNSSTWTGALAGGSEKYEERRKAMMDLVHEEAARVCGEMGYSLSGTPTFEMTDRSDSNVFASPQTQNAVLTASGGGALPVLVLELLAAANSPSENIPISVEETFRCKDEVGKGGELKKRT